MKNQLISQRLQVNAGIMAWYVKELTKMTQAMTKECKEELARIYKKGYPQIAFDGGAGAGANGGEEPRLRGTTKSGAGAEDGSNELSTVSTTDEKAIELIEDKGYNVSCQYRITDYSENIEDKLHNGNPYDKEILDGVFEHLAIVENPRYEGAMIAVNAIMDKNAICRNEFKEQDHPRDEEGKFTEGESIAINPNYKQELKEVIDKAKNNPNERQKLIIGKTSDDLIKKARDKGFNVEGFNHDLDVSGVRHAYNLSEFIEVLKAINNS